MDVLLFGIAKDIVGASQLVLSELERPSSVAALKTKLSEEYPGFEKLSSVAVAVNSEYANDDVPLGRNDEVAIIPPVSGG